MDQIKKQYQEQLQYIKNLIQLQKQGGMEEEEEEEEELDLQFSLSEDQNKHVAMREG